MKMGQSQIKKNNNLKLDKRILAVVSVFGLFLVWLLIAKGGAVRSYFLPDPYAVAYALYKLFAKQHFLADIAISIFRIFTGFTIAVILAIPCGILIGLNKKAEYLLEPIIDFVRYTPIPAFIPLFILWFGIGETEKIIVIASTVFFQLVLMVTNSVSRVPSELIDSAQTLGASPTQTVIKVIYPWTKPSIFDDLRINLGWAWSGLVLAEIVGSTSGVGFVIIQSQRLLQTPNVIAAIIVVGALGLTSDLIFKKLYNYYFPWAPKLDRYART